MNKEKLNALRKTLISQKGLAVLLLLFLGIGFTIFVLGQRQDIRQRAASEPACIPSGDETRINEALQGIGAKAILCKNSTFLIKKTIRFTAPNQELYTEGFPTDLSRALIQIDDASINTAINATDYSGIKIKNIRVDGNRSKLGIGSDALIVLGSGSDAITKDQLIDHVDAFDPRGWTTLLLLHGTGYKDENGKPHMSCTDITVSNNTIGPSGWPDHEWADGISVACENSKIINNTVIDPTDVGIVIFGAPGTLVQNNTIKAVTRRLLGGIALVDNAMDEKGTSLARTVIGDYTGVIVQNNTIVAERATINIGIAMGQATWFCGATTINTGATVINNLVSGKYVGYSYAINGVKNWTFEGNTSTASHIDSYVLPAPGCGVTNPTKPTAYIVDTKRSEGTFQEGYVNGINPGILNIKNSLGDWVPVHCNGKNELKGCAPIGANRCSDFGNASYANWDDKNEFSVCNFACNQPDPNTYCTNPVIPGAVVVEPTPSSTNYGGSTRKAILLGDIGNVAEFAKLCSDAGVFPCKIDIATQFKNFDVSDPKSEFYTYEFLVAGDRYVVLSKAGSVTEEQGYGGSTRKMLAQGNISEVAEFAKLCSDAGVFPCRLDVVSQFKDFDTTSGELSNTEFLTAGTKFVVLGKAGSTPEGNGYGGSSRKLLVQGNISDVSEFRQLCNDAGISQCKLDVATQFKDFDTITGDFANAEFLTTGTRFAVLGKAGSAESGKGYGGSTRKALYTGNISEVAEFNQLCTDAKISPCTLAIASHFKNFDTSDSNEPLSNAEFLATGTRYVVLGNAGGVPVTTPTPFIDGVTGPSQVTCNTSPREVKTGQAVTYTTSTNPSTPTKGTYRYNWITQDPFRDTITGSGSSITITYSSSGEKTVKVAVVTNVPREGTSTPTFATCPTVQITTN